MHQAKFINLQDQQKTNIAIRYLSTPPNQRAKYLQNQINFLRKLQNKKPVPVPPVPPIPPAPSSTA